MQQSTVRNCNCVPKHNQYYAGLNVTRLELGMDGCTERVQSGLETSSLASLCQQTKLLVLHMCALQLCVSFGNLESRDHHSSVKS